MKNNIQKPRETAGEPFTILWASERWQKTAPRSGPRIPVQSRLALLVTAAKLRWSNWNVGCLSGIKKGCTPRFSLARSRNAKSSKREINVEYDHTARSQRT